jgi:iron complex transport system ATP-binding protein
MSHKKSALKLGVVGQENDVPFDFLVEEIVAMGRSPHKKLFDNDKYKPVDELQIALLFQ